MEHEAMQDGATDREGEPGPRQQLPREEERDSVAPQPEASDPADAGGDSPGVEVGVPDRPAASDGPATTAEELREPSLERRLAMERPDTSDRDPATETSQDPRPLMDDDVAAEDLDVDRAGFDPAEADLDRSRAEVAEETREDLDDGPEGAAMHIEEG